MWKEIPPFSFSAGERKIMAHFVVNEIKVIVPGYPHGSLKNHFGMKTRSEKLCLAQSRGSTVLLSSRP